MPDETLIDHGFFVPARNNDLITWLLENGFQIGWPANLMPWAHIKIRLCLFFRLWHAEPFKQKLWPSKP
jgi:hypothetical protein